MARYSKPGCESAAAQLATQQPTRLALLQYRESQTMRFSILCFQAAGHKLPWKASTLEIHPQVCHALTTHCLDMCQGLGRPKLCCGLECTLLNEEEVRE